MNTNCLNWNAVRKNDGCRCIMERIRCGRQTGCLAEWCAGTVWDWTLLPNDVNWNFCRALTTVESVEHSLLVSDAARHNAESLPRRTVSCGSAHRHLQFSHWHHIQLSTSLGFRHVSEFEFERCRNPTAFCKSEIWQTFRDIYAGFGFPTFLLESLFMAALCNRARHYILPCGFYLLLLPSFLPRLIAAVGDWVSIILPQSTRSVALVRI